jgi:hypothetical protein
MSIIYYTYKALLLLHRVHAGRCTHSKTKHTTTTRDAHTHTHKDRIIEPTKPTTTTVIYQKNGHRTKKKLVAEDIEKKKNVSSSPLH